MTIEEEGFDLGFTDQRFPDCAHVCLVYDDEAQRRTIVSQYLQAGLQHGELVSYLADAAAPDATREWLLDQGVEVDSGEREGRLKLLTAEAGYYPTGQFDPREMIRRTSARYEVARAAGFTGSRACGEMSWALRGLPGSDGLLEYEVLIGALVATYPHIGMCQYDARRFDGATIFKILQVHPFMVARGQIVRNPFYVRPEEFIQGQSHR